jgi:hypothetical protein
MADNLFSLDSLTNNPSYDFINSLHNDDDNDSDFDIRSPYDLNTFDCSYSDLSSFNSTYSKNPYVSLFSLNIQSLPAKFAELKELIITMYKAGTSPDIICLQELWNFPSNINFSLPGYGKLIFRLRADDVQGGGWVTLLNPPSNTQSLLSTQLLLIVYMNLCLLISLYKMVKNSLSVMFTGLEIIQD